MYCLFDKVKIVGGPYKGETGTITQVFPKGSMEHDETVYTVKYDNTITANTQGMFKHSFLGKVEDIEDKIAHTQISFPYGDPPLADDINMRVRLRHILMVLDNKSRIIIGMNNGNDDINVIIETNKEAIVLDDKFQKYLSMEVTKVSAMFVVDRLCDAYLVVLKETE